MCRGGGEGCVGKAERGESGFRLDGGRGGEVERMERREEAKEHEKGEGWR